VQKRAGHASVNATMGYVHPQDEEFNVLIAASVANADETAG
jgi:hypothetical protein